MRVSAICVQNQIYAKRFCTKKHTEFPEQRLKDTEPKPSQEISFKNNKGAFMGMLGGALVGLTAGALIIVTGGAAAVPVATVLGAGAGAGAQIGGITGGLVSGKESG